MTDIVLMRSIRHTLLYYSLFEYPLTAVELWQLLPHTTGIGLREVIETAVSMPDVVNERGFFYLRTYFFDGRGKSKYEGRCLDAYELRRYGGWEDTTSPVLGRLQRYLVAIRLYKRLFFWLPIIRRLPYLRAIFVSGSLTLGAPSQESDIDVCMIAKSKRLWTARFWVLCVLRLFGIRPQVVPPLGKLEGTNAGAFCCNLWLTQDEMGVGDFQKGDDMYMRQWFRRLWPVWGYTHEAISLFYQSNQEIAVLKKDADLVVQSRTQKLFELLVGLLPESWYKAVQWSIMPRLMREMASQGSSSVVIEDRRAKFHLVDKRDIYNAAWRERIMEYEKQNPSYGERSPASFS